MPNLKKFGPVFLNSVKRRGRKKTYTPDAGDRALVKSYRATAERKQRAENKTSHSLNS